MTKPSLSHPRKILVKRSSLSTAQTACYFKTDDPDSDLSFAKKDHAAQFTISNKNTFKLKIFLLPPACTGEFQETHGLNVFLGFCMCCVTPCLMVL
jgi:hypothetical protein